MLNILGIFSQELYQFSRNILEQLLTPVTKAFHVVAGNPARIIKKIELKEPDPTLAASEKSDIVVAAAERT